MTTSIPDSDAGTAPPEAARNLGAEALEVSYGGRLAVQALSVGIRPGSFTVIVGPNACGKSTLLRALARVLPPSAGRVMLDGADVRRLGAKDLARRIGLLPQASTAPEAITVIDLVSRGRFPHQKLLQRWSEADEEAVREALELTGLAALSRRVVDELSGGQRQRVWIATVLAQETPILLLDEPTTYLDLAHQLEVLELCRLLHERGRTVVAVLHDLNQAARYADHLIAMRDGRIIAEGAPVDVVTPELVREVFGVRAAIIPDPESGTPMVVPLARGALMSSEP